MTKNYFETEKIQTVTLSMETLSGMKWLEERPEKIRKFLGITISKELRLQAGWGYGTYRERYTTEELAKEWPYLRVDEKEKKVYNKSYVSIYFSYKHSIGARFESNEEAQEYVDELIEQSGRIFNVIIN
jgi:hypothetical protein